MASYPNDTLIVLLKDLITISKSNQKTKLLDSTGNLITLLNALPVQVVSGGGGSAGDSFVGNVTTYTVTTSFVDNGNTNSIGDIITLTQLIDATSTPPIIKSNLWRNQTTAKDLIAAPSFTNLSLEGTAALTNAQLRATPVPVVDSHLTDSSQKSQIVDGSGNVIGSTLILTKQRLDVNLAAGGTPNATAPNWADQVGGVDGSGNLQPLQIDASKNLKVAVQSSSLPTGAATSANQTTEIAALNQLHADLIAPLPAGSATIGSVNVIGNATDNTSLFSGTISSAGAQTAFDTTGYQSLVVQVTGAWEGNITFEGNTDNASTWNLIPIIALDRLNPISDIINESGIYIIKTVTRYTRINLIQEISGSVTINVIGRTISAVDPSDIMSSAFDPTNPLYVSEVGIKKDINKQIILSDGPAPVQVQGAVNTVILIDTLGYQSLQFTSNGIAGSVTTSNDGINFSALTGAPVVLGALVTAITANASFIFPVLARWIKITVTTAGIGTYFLRNAQFNPLYTTTPYVTGAIGVNGGVAGIQSIGGNIAIGTARTANPVPVGGVDINNLTRANLLSVIGQPYVAGPGESITQFSVGTGASAVTDGTNGKTIFVQPKESDVYMEISAISTSPTIELEGSYDNQLFFVIPMTRVDNTAASLQYPQTVATSTITPVAGALYRGKTYGCPILRVHLVAGTTSNTIGTIRVVPIPVESGVTSSPFGLVLANTTESVGVANGQIFQQGVRTLTVPSRGSCKVQLIIDAMTWTGTMSAGIQVVVEGLNDSAATTWNALALQPLSGGATVTTITGPATAYSIPYSGVWEADLGAGNYNQVRVRLANVGTGGTAPLVIGGLRIIPVATNQGIGTSSKTTFTAAVSGIAATTTNNLIVIESGAAKRTTIRKIYFTPGTATAASLINLTVYRETSASSGGATQTPSGRQSSDSFSGIVRITNPTLGTNAATNIVFPIPTAITASVYSTPFVYDFTNGGTEPGLVLPIGTANGVAFQTAGATGGAGAGLLVEFTEE